MSSSSPRIAIVGGGLSGLSTAYELNRRGHQNFVLFEASPRLGGIVETHREDGFVIECGADSWVSEKPWARELAVELGLESEIIPSQDSRRRTYLLMQNGDKNELVPMPDGMRMMVPTDLDAIDRSTLFSEEARQAYRREPSRAEELKAFAATRSADQDESVASFVRRHFGDEATEKIAGPLLAGVFGGDIRQLSASAVMAPFVKMEREQGSLILALQHQQRATGEKRAVFTSLKHGVQSLIDGMAAAVPHSAVRLQEPVLGIARTADHWEVKTVAGVTVFDHVVLATPVHTTRELIAPWHDQLQLLLAIDSSSAVIAAFAFNREQSASLKIPEGFGFLAPQMQGSRPSGAEPELLACTFVDQKFSHRAPEGGVILRTVFGGQAASPLLARSDEFILTLARQRLWQIFGIIPEARISLVRRWPRSLPQYALGHLVRVARIEALVREIPRLRIIGNALHGVGLPDMVHQGRSAAAELLSAP